MKKILIAEDDQPIIDIVTLILEGEGYTTIVAKHEKDIRHAILHQKPHLILLDIRLDGLDGGEFAKTLKSQESTKALPIILMSANHETEKISKIAGADDFLLKPFDINELLQIVKKYVP